MGVRTQDIVEITCRPRIKGDLPATIAAVYPLHLYSSIPSSRLSACSTVMVYLKPLLSGAVFAAAGSASALLPRQVNDTNSNPLDSCPGYEASNVQNTGNSLTADLTLAGPACNAYGDDLVDLRLSVTYETGMLVFE